MKLNLTILKLLKVALASLDIRQLRSFTNDLDSGAVQREVLARKFRAEIMQVFGNKYSTDLYKDGSDVERIYDDMKESYFKSIFSKKRSNFSSQKKIFKYCCLLFF